jgi:hypothetical protein
MKRRSFDHEILLFPGGGAWGAHRGSMRIPRSLVGALKMQQSIGTLKETSVWHLAFFWSKS